MVTDNYRARWFARETLKNYVGEKEACVLRKEESTRLNDAER